MLVGGALRAPSNLQALITRVRSSHVYGNAFWVTAALVFNKLLGLAMLGYAARKLGTAGYGLAGWGVSVAAYAGIVVSPGLVTWGSRAVARDRVSAGRMLVAVNGTQIVLATIAYSAVAFFALFFLESAAHRTIVLLSALALFNTALSADWVIAGLERMRITAILNMVSGILMAASLLLFVRSPADVYTYPVLRIAVDFTIIAGGYFALLWVLGVKPSVPSRFEIKTALRDMAPLAVMSGLVILLQHANNFIVHSELGVAQLGIFLAAFALFIQVKTLRAVVGSVFIPYLSRVAVSARASAAADAMLFARVHVIAGFMLAALVVVEAPALVRIIYGDAYQQTAPVLRLMGAAILFNYVICGYTNCLIPFGRDRVMLLVLIASAIVSVGGGLLLVPRLGVVGAGIAVASMDLAGWLVSIPAYRRTIGPMQWSTWGRALVGVLVSVLIMTGLGQVGFSFWLRAPLGMLVFLPVFLWDLRVAKGGHCA